MYTTSRYQTRPEVITALIATYDEHIKTEEKAITYAQMCSKYLPSVREGEHFDDVAVSQLHLHFCLISYQWGLWSPARGPL